MPVRYAANSAGATANINPLVSPGRTVLSVQVPGLAMIRARVAEWAVGSGAAPQDAQVEWLIQRSTTAGTSTAITARLLDAAYAAAIMVAGAAFTAEPTYTAGSSLYDEGVAQRASYRWVAVPGFEWVIPAVANNGIGLVAIVPSALATAMTGNLVWEE